MTSNVIDDKLLLEASRERDGLLSAMQSVMLSTVNTAGSPNSSYAPCLYCGDSKRFYIYISTLSRHTKNLIENPYLSMMIIEDESKSDNLFARKRYTIEASSEIINRDSDKWNNIMDLMVSKFGETLTYLKELTDFKMFELNPSDSLLVYGFGKAFRFSKDNFDYADHLNDKGHKK